MHTLSLSLSLSLAVSLSLCLSLIDEVQVPCSPGINPAYGEPGGSEYIFYNTVIGRVRKTQPQVVLSGEDCAGWDDAIAHNFQLPGTKNSEVYQQAMRAAVEAKNLDALEDVVAGSGADAAAVICYLHPQLDGKPAGACPTLYYRDTQESYSTQNVSIHQLWVALEAASGILSEHQHSPTAVFGQQFGSWNVTADPYVLRIIYIRYIHRYIHTNSTYKYRIYIIRSTYPRSLQRRFDVCPRTVPSPRR